MSETGSLKYRAVYEMTDLAVAFHTIKNYVAEAEIVNAMYNYLYDYKNELDEAIKAQSNSGQDQ
ncbi:MAG: hypothetical protein KAS32_00355 [Candidatus Peribacteraceae bacterium]|nr:hypothetical protein [Candidatus Peribacteraceae bacterium]